MSKTIEVHRICEYERQRDINIAEKEEQFEVIFGHSPNQSRTTKKDSNQKLGKKANKLSVKPTRRSTRGKPEVNYCELESVSKQHKTVQNSASKVEYVDIPREVKIRPNTSKIEDTSVHHAELVCSVCNKEFRFKNSLVKHVKATHENSAFPCDICNKTFSYLSDLKRHIGINHSEHKVNYKCAQCNTFFLYRFTLMKHIRNYHM
eukprot:GFUD01074901.1.p1 GENE.GFUD01074901.1~~GFUD01074901.1.p1  ORF type:complete len:205 (+),score=23.12 GFUD01074901.1:38-652(+)